MLRRNGALLTIVFAVACAGGTPTEPSPTPLMVSLQSSAWETISEPRPYPLSNQGAALTLDFPTSGSMHYLFTASPQASIHGTLVVSFTVATSGPVVFNSLDPQSTQCSIASSVRPFIWANDNGEGSYDRWWSNPRSFTLAAGSGTLTVPLKPENWSSVNGRFGNADDSTRWFFERALLNVTRLGLTFGGGCSFGHGINVRGGSASFSLTEYRIQ
jgi:hypothetical protein